MIASKGAALIPVLLIALPLAAFGCGARTAFELDETLAAGGDQGPAVGPGGPGSGGAGAGGAGPGGGGGVCDPLATERLLVVETPPIDQELPQLTLLDDGRVTVLMRWRLPDTPIADSELRHVTFTPDPWPSDELGPVYLASLTGGATFAVAPRSTSTVAYAFGDDAGLRFADGLVPGSGDVPPSAMVSPTSPRVSFVERGLLSGEPVALVGFQLPPMVGDWKNNALAFMTAGPTSNGAIPLMCATGDPRAAAVALDSGFLLAMVSGHELGTEDCSAPPTPPPHWLITLRMNDQFDFLAGMQRDTRTTITNVQMAATDTGALVVYADGSDTLWAVPIGANAAAASEPVLLASGASREFALAARDGAVELVYRIDDVTRLARLDPTTLTLSSVVNLPELSQARAMLSPPGESFTIVAGVDDGRVALHRIDCR